MEQPAQATPLEYFSVKLLTIRYSIDNGKTWDDYEITEGTKEMLWNNKYTLEDGRHYTPTEFIDYMKNISKDNKHYMYNVYFKYIFFNHHMDEEYQNVYRLHNNNIYLLYR